MMTSPTQHTYDSLNKAYNFFNEKLFSGLLPTCLITMQRKNKAYGYFAGDRFTTRDGSRKADEIALNPSHFRARTTEEVLSTLAHEMAHLWQHHYGKPSRTTYHNREWAQCMRGIGLVPSNTGQPGGKETGQQMTHYIEAQGKFAITCAELIASGFDLSYIELWQEGNSQKKKAASKTKYTCPDCSCRLTRLIAKRGRNASVRELGDDMSQKNCKEKSLSDEDWPCFTAILSGLAQMATLGIAIWRFSRWTASEIAGMIFLAKKWST